MSLVLFNMLRSGDFYWRYTILDIRLGNANLMLSIVAAFLISIGACSKWQMWSLLVILTTAITMILTAAMHLLTFDPAPKPDWYTFIQAELMLIGAFLFPALILGYYRRRHG